MLVVRLLVEVVVGVVGLGFVVVWGVVVVVVVVDWPKEQKRQRTLASPEMISSRHQIQASSREKFPARKWI